MSEIVFGFHSGWRYVVLIAALLTLIAVLADARNGVLGTRATRALRAFVGTLDIQLLAGLILVFMRPFLPALIGHIVMMAAAVTVAHLLVVSLKKRPPERRTPALAATGVLICLALIVAGILAIGRPIV